MKHWFLISSFTIICLIDFLYLTAQGIRIDTTVHSYSLEDNFLGDSPSRGVNIYLPSCYEENTDKHYPVIYFLHGFNRDYNHLFRNIATSLDTLLEQGKIKPMIVVEPSSLNKYHSSWYTNSIVTGKWEDFIIKDLIEYIDANYRTLQQTASRGLAGHSTGGYGAIKLAMKHPDIYGSVYALSPAWVCFEEVILDLFKGAIWNAQSAEVFPTNWREQAVIACAAAFAPNINSLPFYGDLPLLSFEVQLIDSIWAKWLQHDPLTLIPKYRENILRWNGFVFDCGNDDELEDSNIHFSQALIDASIPHTFMTYSGDHLNNIPDRIEEKMLPYFSEILVDSIITKLISKPNIPNSIQLNQNYPNPFNPNTIIKYSIPEQNTVTLKVFDVLGREVITLANKEQSQGNYEVEFDGGELTSGIYFYILQAGDYTETKKMILLK